MNAEAITEDRRSPWPKVLIGIAVLAALLFAYKALPVQEYVTSFQDWVKGYGVVGWFIFIVVYALTAFALIPGSLLTLAAGVIWGLGGFPIVIVGATIGSAISFLAARYLFKDRVQEKVAQYPKFRAVNEAIGEEFYSNKIQNN